MGILLDFKGSRLAPETAGRVLYAEFGEDGLSPVYAVAAVSSDAGEYRPAPQEILPQSSQVRVGVTAQDCAVATWGSSIYVDADLDFDGAPFYIQFRRTLDGAEVSLPAALSIRSDGFVVVEGARGTGFNVSSGEGTAFQTVLVVGTGYSVSTGAGDATMTAVAEGVGYNESSGAGLATTGVDTAEGVGYNVSSGSGAATMTANAVGTGSNTSSGSGTVTVNLGVPSLTGTYFVDFAERSGGLTGDKKLVVQAERTAGYYGLCESPFTSGTATVQYRLVVLDSTGAITRSVKDWTTVATATYDEGGFDSGLAQSSASFANPAVSATEYFALQSRTVADTTNTSPFMTLAQGVNPGAQSNATVYLMWEWAGYEGGYVGTGAGNASTAVTNVTRLVFGGV